MKYFFKTIFIVVVSSVLISCNCRSGNSFSGREADAKEIIKELNSGNDIYIENATINGDVDLRLIEKLTKENVSRITSYNVCYTKLLRLGFNVENKLLLQPFSFYVNCFTLPDLFTHVRYMLYTTTPGMILTVITSYSIHYTKLYDFECFSGAIRNSSFRIPERTIA